jgi:hypothetical protein
MKPGALVTIIEEFPWLWSVDPNVTEIMTVSEHGRVVAPGEVGILIAMGKLPALDTYNNKFACVLFCSGAMAGCGRVYCQRCRNNRGRPSA